MAGQQRVELGPRGNDLGAVVTHEFEKLAYLARKRAIGFRELPQIVSEAAMLFARFLRCCLRSRELCCWRLRSTLEGCAW